MDVAIEEPRTTRNRALPVVVLVTVMLGVVAAAGVAAGTPPGERTFAAVSEPTQTLMSVTVPFLGVLLVGRLRPPVRPDAVRSVVGRAVVLALLLAGFGVLACATATAAFPSTAVDGRWSGAGMVVLGSLLVQGVAQLVGTGMGLLIRRPVVAGLATIVLPLGLWALLGAVAALRPAQAWLTPFPSAQHLLTGPMDLTAWLQWFTVLAIWGLGLNVLGVLRARRRGGN